MPADANARLGGTPTLKYFDLRAAGGIAGRGGAMRFFFLQHGVKFTDDLVSFADWGTGLKQACIDSGENPFGNLPIVTLGGSIMVQSYSVLRRLSRSLGLYGQDLDRDYQVDVIMDSVADWRTAWVTAANGDDAAKAKYRDQTRPAALAALEIMLTRCRATGLHSVGGQDSPADALVFAQLWDDTGLFGPLSLEPYPHVKTFYEAYHALAPIKAWCDSMRPAQVAAA